MVVFVFYVAMYFVKESRAISALSGNFAHLRVYLHCNALFINSTMNKKTEIRVTKVQHLKSLKCQVLSVFC